MLKLTENVTKKRKNGGEGKIIQWHFLHCLSFLPFGAGCRFLVFRGCAWRVDRGCWRRLVLVWQVGGRRRFVGRRAGGGNGLFEGGWKGIGIGLARFLLFRGRILVLADFLLWCRAAQFSSQSIYLAGRWAGVFGFPGFILARAGVGRVLRRRGGGLGLFCVGSAGLLGRRWLCPTSRIRFGDC